MNLDYEINYEEIIDMYTQMLGWNHDFNNHINMILGLLEVGTKEDAISYINELNSNIQKLGKNIYTDDLVINSILITNIKAAEEKNIKINLDLKIDSPKRISDVDTCIILGNLLDNSIEACSYIKGDKFIDLKIVSQNDRLIFKISNNTNGNIKEVNGSFLSTKKKNMYGIGLTQIDSTVKKLNGYVNRKHKNNLFTTYIMIEY